MKNYESKGRALAPIYDFVDLDYTAQVKSIKDSYWVVFNRLRRKFVVMDKDLHGTPYCALIVMEMDGSFRPFDDRTLETLRRLTQRGPDVRKILGELEGMEKEREHKSEKDLEELTYGFAESLKWLGVDVVASTAWRDRGLEHEARVRREQIRALSQ